MYFSKFEPPVDYYDERIKEIDEEICALIKKRKDMSNNNPGFPTATLITSWAEKFDLYEDFLNGLFSHLHSEDLFQPRIEPKKFIKNIPVLKSTEIEDLFFTITFIRQYQNASIVNLIIDREGFEGETDHLGPHDFFNQSYDLLVTDQQGTDYNAVSHGGSGTDDHMAIQYIISPPLPLDSTTIQLNFREMKTKNNFTFSIQLI